MREIGPACRNLANAFVEADMDRLGIRRGERFHVRCGDKEVSPLYGKTYGDVPKGEWVAFVMADGCIKVARNPASVAEAL